MCGRVGSYPNRPTARRTCAGLECGQDGPIDGGTCIVVVLKGEEGSFKLFLSLVKSVEFSASRKLTKMLRYASVVKNYYPRSEASRLQGLHPAPNKVHILRVLCTSSIETIKRIHICNLTTTYLTRNTFIILTKPLPSIS